MQPASLEVRQPRVDPTFSEPSSGLRPGRSAQPAMAKAQASGEEGRRYAVDVGVEKFLDRVNPAVLRGRRAKRMADKRMLRLSRRSLAAGILRHGVVSERHEGTPHGGPRSPVWATVLRDEGAKEVEKRGQAFGRFAEDCPVYVRSPRAGERVLTFLRKPYAQLPLRSNAAKSAGARVITRQCLGLACWRGPGGQWRRGVWPTRPWTPGKTAGGRARGAAAAGACRRSWRS